MPLLLKVESTIPHYVAASKERFHPNGSYYFLLISQGRNRPLSPLHQTRKHSMTKKEITATLTLLGKHTHPLNGIRKAASKAHAYAHLDHSDNQKRIATYVGNTDKKRPLPEISGSRIQRPRLFRPPGGRFSTRMYNAVVFRGSGSSGYASRDISWSDFLPDVLHELYSTGRAISTRGYRSWLEPFKMLVRKNSSS